MEGQIKQVPCTYHRKKNSPDFYFISSLKWHLSIFLGTALIKDWACMIKKGLQIKVSRSASYTICKISPKIKIPGPSAELLDLNSSQVFTFSIHSPRISLKDTGKFNTHFCRWVQNTNMESFHWFLIGSICSFIQSSSSLPRYIFTE